MNIINGKKGLVVFRKCIWYSLLMQSLEIINAKGLKKSYDQATAVNGTSFYIFQGECYGFIGPNGAGKTTTIKMITCFSPRDSGELTVNGMDVAEHPREIKELMGVVPQEENLDPDLTVLKNLLVYARYFNIPQSEAFDRAHELLDFFSLTQRGNSMIRELSGGMKRRLLIARALINNPKILVLDEPTTGLDPQARHHIWQRLRLLKKKGITMVLSTHYMEEASQLCDRIAIMDMGKILIEGRPNNLVNEKIGKEVVEMRVDDNTEEKLLQKLTDFDFEHERISDSLYFFLKDGREFLKFLIEEHHTQLIHRPAGLEDLFLRLTGKGLRD